MNRYWCGQAHYPGFSSFTFGSVVVDRQAATHEVEKALRDLWGSHSPHPCPSFVAIPGILLFKPEVETP